MKSAKYKTGKKSVLLPIVRILIESAALQLFVEILLLALYSRRVDAQDILLELVTPAVVSCFEHSCDTNVLDLTTLPQQRGLHSTR